LDRIQAFKHRWVLEHQVVADAATVSAASQFPRKVSTASGDADEDQLATTKSETSPRLSVGTVRALSVVGISICAIAAIFVLIRASRPAPDQLAQQQESESTFGQTVTAVAPDPTIDRPTTEAVDSEPTEEAVALETFDSASETEMESIAEDELSMSLEGLLPPIDDLAVDDAVSDPQSPDASNTDSDPTSVPDATSQDSDSAVSNDSSEPKFAGPVDSQLDKEEPIPEESPQQTRQSTVSAVQLRAIDDSEAVVTLAESSLTGLDVDFPYDVPLEVKSEDSGWSIRDTRKDVVLATIRSVEDRTELSWTDTAKQSPNAVALANGRITNDDDGTIFLRPTIESDPWKFRFDQSDVMPTWNLNHPIPPRVARLEVEFELPDKVEFGWVEPIEPSELRRTRATAIIAPVDDEEISLGIRFDIRCSRKLSCRMRFAARLDPSMNWQIVSTPSLNQFADQLTDYATMVSNEAERLAKVYSSLDNRAARRHIRNKQDHNKKLTAQVTTAAERVAKLQTLMAQLESDGAIGFRVWVEWPDTEQTLLSARTPEAEETTAE
jgi:hypothetical protein